jgi:predicted DsbA family dithiol-disulfide isomerase
MKLDIVSDVVCPWCFIGKRRLEKAMELRPDYKFEIIWRPYQLNPNMPATGMPHKEYYRGKFGSKEQVKQLTDNMTAVGADVGINFDFDNIPMAPNTMDAHRLIRWSYSTGHQGAVVEALFNAYFHEANDVGTTAVLMDIAQSVGMDTNVLKLLLEEDAETREVAAEVKQATEMGITGVPFIVIENKFAIPGAQEPEAIAQVMDQAFEASKSA